MSDPSTQEIVAYVVLWLIASIYLIRSHKGINGGKSQ